ncbi:MAG: metallopeptidase family protein [Candidatus Microbacterium phytovorans]|uniref:Metallopeptidase family protein n=1 Tax=Candidatus Microbacterium phytovorans TaxID=3121374 RepID=A0AAJ5W2I9_9MICO|nr:metallopeptidase family protein [Microbacterium sp.]WEK13814.1 MAG: metallopeptidase family protein [Microbacterium sp.]
MIRRRRTSAPESARAATPSRHGRHGREDRSPVVRPPLPPLETRADKFDLAVGTAAEFLRSAWSELRDVRFEVASMPSAADDDGIPRWSVSTTEKRITLYRLPIERLSHLHRDDELHRRMMIESCVFRAAAQYLDRDPWDLGPERFRFF